jgi:ribosomal protein S27AE
MAKKGSVGEYICGRCGGTMRLMDKPNRDTYVNKGNGVTRINLVCNKCNGEDYYDSCGN